MADRQVTAVLFVPGMHGQTAGEFQLFVLYLQELK